MRRLYRAIETLLRADYGTEGDLGWLLGRTDEDARIYQTAVQEHVQAANTGIRWVTYNKVADVGDGADQTTAIRDSVIDFHCWARESDSSGADAVHDRLKVLLDGKAQKLHDLDEKLLVMKCFYHSYLKQFEPDTKLWHVIASYEVMHADVEEV